MQLSSSEVVRRKTWDESKCIFPNREDERWRIPQKRITSFHSHSLSSGTQEFIEKGNNVIDWGTQWRLGWGCRMHSPDWWPMHPSTRQVSHYQQTVGAWTSVVTSEAQEDLLLCRTLSKTSSNNCMFRVRRKKERTEFGWALFTPTLLCIKPQYNIRTSFWKWRLFNRCTVFQLKR